MKKCPYCAEEIKDEAILCRYCQSPQTIFHIEYYKNGNKKEEGNYKGGKKDGKWIGWDEYTGKVWIVENWKDGKQHGLMQTMREDGSPHREGNYKEGKRDGFWSKWKDGEMISKTTLKDGEWVSGEYDSFLL